MQRRIKIMCLSCGSIYVTRLLRHGLPHRCKVCGSVKITKLQGYM